MTAGAKIVVWPESDAGTGGAVAAGDSKRPTSSTNLWCFLDLLAGQVSKKTLPMGKVTNEWCLNDIGLQYVESV